MVGLHVLEGWRIGWAIAPPAVSAAIGNIHVKLTDSAPAPFQEAALVALQSSPSFYTQLKQVNVLCLMLIIILACCYLS